MAGERPVTRRLLLTAGGLTLLAGCSTTPPSRGGQTKTLTKSPVAAREPEATGEFAGDREPATAHPALTPPPGTAGSYIEIASALGLGKPEQAEPPAAHTYPDAGETE